MQIPSGSPDAVACMTGSRGAPRLHGTVKFYTMAKGVLVVARIWGLPTSETDIFALHIHEGAGCTGAEFSDTGGHFNPGAQPHPRHAGDLPPLFSCGGRAFLAVLTDRFRVRDIIGRTVVIHSSPDDFRTQPAGGAGEKIACGTVRAQESGKTCKKYCGEPGGVL